MAFLLLIFLGLGSGESAISDRFDVNAGMVLSKGPESADDGLAGGKTEDLDQMPLAPPSPPSPPLFPAIARVAAAFTFFSIIDANGTLGGLQP